MKRFDWAMTGLLFAMMALLGGAVLAFRAGETWLGLYLGGALVIIVGVMVRTPKYPPRWLP